ncbi:MAG: cell division protein FtsX [Acidimicrobiales bacterium]
MNLSYVARETFTNLRRNLSMAWAALLTVAVSLTLVGGALLVKRAADRATVQWKGNVELSVFMKPDASAGEIAAVARILKDRETSSVKSSVYLEKEKAFEEFRTIFANEPDILNSLTLEEIPTSFRVVPLKAELTKIIGDSVQNSAGVFRVSYAQEEVEELVRFTNYIQVGLWVVAAVLLVAASLLILNTIRMAIFARRREVAVMKLVGATNWFIRIPFMLEGLIQGLAGAALAYFLMWVIRASLEGVIQGSQGSIIGQFWVTPADVAGTGLFLLLVGVVVGSLGSFLAVRRFLDV